MSTFHMPASLLFALPRLVSLRDTRLAPKEAARSVVLALFVPSPVWQVAVSAASLAVLHALRLAQAGAVDEKRKASLMGLIRCELSDAQSLHMWWSPPH